MIKGLLVIQQGGIPVYSFMQEKTPDDQQLFISSFVTAMQDFVKTMISREADGVRKVYMSHTVFAFRILSLRNDEQEDTQYCFALLSDSDKKGEDLPEMLEYLIVCFLAYDSGRFDRELRKRAQNPIVFKAFDEFLKGFMKADWSTVRKKVRPAPASLLQGVLNELRDHVPIEQIVALHPRIQRLGPSYAWLSDDLPESEQRELMQKIRQILKRTYGEGVFESIIDDVQKRLLTRTPLRS